MQPGDTITPGGQPAPETHLEPDVVVDLNKPAITTPEADVLPAESMSQPPDLPPPQEKPAEPESTPWQFKGSEQSGGQPSEPSNDAVSWSASEYVAHQKNASWFIGLGLVVAVVTIVVYLISHDFVSPVMIALLGIVFGIFAARQPRVLEYSVNQNGVAIGSKMYTYESFKAFSVIQDGIVHSIVLAPLQRFMPPISVYYEPSDEVRIMDVISNYLPFEDAKPDPVDNLMRRVRF